MTESYLKNILDYKEILNDEKKDFFHSLKWKVKECPCHHAFKNALSGPGQIKLIAEIKKASPSKGLIRDFFDLPAIAETYAHSGVAAISVLTEDKYFLGKPEFVRQVRDLVEVPILAKDFFITDGQIYEARFNGADAILLIAAILDDNQLKELIHVATEIGLDCLVEVHNERELVRACAAGAEIIGVNNRDLLAFGVEMKTSENLIPKVPKDKIIVGESGFQTYSQVKALKELGAHAVLIGETFMREHDIEKKIKEVMYGQS